MTALRASTLFALLSTVAAPVAAQHSVARQWNELLLQSIRRDFARPTVHARNLCHISMAMWDAWAAYDPTADCAIFTEDHATNDPMIDAWREEALSYAVYRILKARFATSPGALVMLPQYDAQMGTLGYDTSNTSTAGNSPAAVGNRIAAAVLAHGLADHSNEQGGYANQYYTPVNDPLLPALPGNPAMTDPSRWQPLALSFFKDQSCNIIVGGYPGFLSPEWGQVTSFALSQNDLSVYRRGGFDYWVFHDPGPPPYLGTTSAEAYRKGFEMVAVWSSHLDPSDGVMIDISPASLGNATLPSGHQYDTFYDFEGGGDWGQGYALNPVTGQPYTPQVVPRGDYARVLAEFWADGPDSETPPGHWFVIANHVFDDPQFSKQIGGVGPVLDDLEWDCKAYLALGGAMHDCAVSAWGVKGWYDFPRPISAIRYMADKGQCSDPSAASYHPEGLTLRPGLIELVTPATTALGQRHAHLFGHEGKIALKAWRGPSFITNPANDTADVGWILAENWWPYQRPSFVTPPFAGYVSGHSTFSRAAAVTMHLLTGSPYFPGGLGEFVCPQNAFLVFEDGPSVTIKLQWASYYDASDQTSLSRIWGGIHPPCDDIPGRIMGQQIGTDAFALAEQYWAGTAPPRASFTTGASTCTGSRGVVTLGAAPTALPVVGSTMEVEITNLPWAATSTLLMLGDIPIMPGLDLGGIGMPSCTFDVLPFVTLNVPAFGGSATWALDVPDDTTWYGQSLHHQAITLDPGVNAAGLTTSTPAEAVIGR